MKNIKTFEAFVSEKSYRMTGIYSAKGLVGKVMQAFKKEIAGVKYEGDAEATLEEINKEWAKFQKNAEKIILDDVENGAKTMDSVVFVTANLGDGFKIDETNGLNSEGSGELFIGYDLVINVGFMDDVDGSRLYKKIDKTGMMNAPLANSADVIYGDYDPEVGDNNLEIRDSEYMSIDAK